MTSVGRAFTGQPRTPALGMAAPMPGRTHGYIRQCKGSCGGQSDGRTWRKPGRRNTHVYKLCYHGRLRNAPQLASPCRNEPLTSRPPSQTCHCQAPAANQTSTPPRTPQMLPIRDTKASVAARPLSLQSCATRWRGGARRRSSPMWMRGVWRGGWASIKTPFGRGRLLREWGSATMGLSMLVS